MSDWDWTDLFSGGGGASRGITDAGQFVRIATNHNEISVETHTRNHPETEHRCADLNNTNFASYPRTRGLWASPSCRYHSAANRGQSKQGGVEDELRRDTPASQDRASAWAVVAAAEEHGYDAVVVENVREFLSWVLRPSWLDAMRRLGYRDQTAIIDAADLGVPQERRRSFTVFTRGGDVDLRLPKTMRRPIVDILEPAAGLGDLLGDRCRYARPQIAEIPEDLLDVSHVATYRRNSHIRDTRTRQLATVTAGGWHHLLVTRTGEGVRARWLGVRELARAQGFPDTDVFAGSVDDQRRQIGNAVATPVARFLAERVAAAVDGRQRVGLAAA
ncbi:site-specific DNA methylase [Mycobacteroides abscessus subsp. abscessus]|nr:site-specific DNA methylase [Mycobacteroides abscessus subsp. abscessus]